MKKLKFPITIGFLLIAAIAFSFANDKNDDISNSSDDVKKGEVIYLTKETFKEQVYNYETSETWKYEGKVPAIIDFYADWCGPCKQLSPVLKQLQKEYGDKIQIYKINTDKEKELAGTFGIRSLPTIVFVPLDGEPQAAMGFRPKSDLETMIKEILKVEK